MSVALRAEHQQTGAKRAKKAKQAKRHLKVVKEGTRKRRVPSIQRGVWKKRRIEKLTDNVKFAGAAKAYRSALNVTQQRVADYFSVTSQAVTHWESGCYFGWNAEELAEYCRLCDRLAG